jgi:hypothetical protein
MEEMKDNTAPLESSKSWVIWLLVSAGLIAVMLYLYYIYPHEVIGPQQPIYFSHRVHAGVKGINCRFCHAFVERSEKPGIPAVGKCLFCHQYIITQHPQIKKLQKHFDTRDPVPWKRVMYVPDHVRFSHERHIRKDIDCTECHGEVKKMDRLMTNVFEMGFCIECHRERNAQMDCWLACHK